MLDSAGRPPLIVASREGHLDIARVLLDAGVPSDSLAEDGITPLLIASERGHADLVKLLIERHANMLTCSEDGLSALQLASLSGHRAVVVQLLHLGCPTSTAAAVMARGAGHIAITDLLEAEANTLE